MLKGPMDRALVLACSQRKNPHASLMPAIDRYDGPAFRVLHRYLREKEDRHLKVYILSGAVTESFETIPLQSPKPMRGTCWTATSPKFTIYGFCSMRRDGWTNTCKPRHTRTTIDVGWITQRICRS